MAETMRLGVLDVCDEFSGNPPYTLFMETVVAKNYKHIASDGWATDRNNAIDYEALGVTLRLNKDGGARVQTLWDGEDFALYMQVDHGRTLFPTIAAATRERVVEVMKKLREMAPAMKPRTDDGSVPVTFWTYTPRGANEFTRRIDAHPWGEVRPNYAAGVADEVDRLMDTSFRPAFGGQLILWHGPPGTGKTHALRALAWEWRNWADVHYVVDPENLFGKHADYLLDVLLADDNQRPPEWAEEYSSQPESAKPRWKVLILEDTGEMLAANAKDRVGQALSRLLNTVDGFIGQGLRILVLITTNEELGALHEAVTRPGRCAAKTLFTPLSAEEAMAWLTERNADPAEVSGQTTLAELYGKVEGYNVQTVPSLVGFTAPPEEQATTVSA